MINPVITAVNAERYTKIVGFLLKIPVIQIAALPNLRRSSEEEKAKKQKGKRQRANKCTILLNVPSPFTGE